MYSFRSIADVAMVKLHPEQYISWILTLAASALLQLMNSELKVKPSKCITLIDLTICPLAVYGIDQPPGQAAALDPSI